MRIVLIGSASERSRLRSEFDRADAEIVGEFESLAAARAADADADAIVLAPGASRRAESDGSEPGAIVEPLTPREVQVLELLAEGLPNKSIATRLGISDQTGKFHVASISGKLGAANRTDAVRRAVRRGLITL
jgi:DNA-binding NarL/FixJ family response regulator